MRDRLKVGPKLQTHWKCGTKKESETFPSPAWFSTRPHFFISYFSVDKQIKNAQITAHRDLDFLYYTNMLTYLRSYLLTLVLLLFYHDINHNETLFYLDVSISIGDRHQKKLLTVLLPVLATHGIVMWRMARLLDNSLYQRRITGAKSSTKWRRK